MRRIELVGHLQHALEANDLGNVLVHDPDHIDGAANTNNGGGGFDIKSPFLEFQQVFCEYLQLARHHTEAGASLLLFGIELKLVQVEIRFLAHCHVASVLKFQPEP